MKYIHLNLVYDTLVFVHNEDKGSKLMVEFRKIIDCVQEYESVAYDAGYIDGKKSLQHKTSRLSQALHELNIAIEELKCT